MNPNRSRQDPLRSPKSTMSNRLVVNNPSHQDDDSSDNEGLDQITSAAMASSGKIPLTELIVREGVPQANAIEDTLKHLSKDDLNKQLLDLAVAQAVFDGEIDLTGCSSRRALEVSVALATQLPKTLEGMPENAFLQEQLLSKLPADRWAEFLDHVLQLTARPSESYGKHERTNIGRIEDMEKPFSDIERQHALFGKRLVDIAASSRLAVLSKCNPLTDIEQLAGPASSAVLLALREHFWSDEAARRAVASARKGIVTKAFSTGLAACTTVAEMDAFRRDFAVKRYQARCDKPLEESWYPACWMTYLLAGAHAEALGGECLPHLQGVGESRLRRDMISRTLSPAQPSMKRKRDTPRAPFAAPRRKNMMWEIEEEAALREAIGKYGYGNFAKILKDPQFSTILQRRSNVSLKDKCRTMKWNKPVTFVGDALLDAAQEAGSEDEEDGGDAGLVRNT